MNEANTAIYKRIPQEQFKCLSCAEQPEFAHQPFRHHLWLVHNIQLPRQGTREMMMHARTRNGGFFVWRWKIGDVHFLERSDKGRER